MGIQGSIITMSGGQFVVAHSGDHGCVVSGEQRGGEEDVERVFLPCFCKPFPQQGIAGHTSGDEDRPDLSGGSCCDGALNQVGDNCLLKACNEIKGGLRAVSAQIFQGSGCRTVGSG